MRIDDLARELESTLYEVRGLFSALDERAATSVPVTGHWTAREVLLHLNAWLERQVEAVRSWPLRDYEQLPPVPDVEAFNAATVASADGVGWREVLRRATDIHRQLVTEVRLRSDDDLDREGESILSNGRRLTLETLVRNGMRHARTHAEEVREKFAG